MKKNLLLIPTLLFPYVIVFLTFCIFTGFLMEEIFDGFFLNILLFLGEYVIVAFIGNIIYIIMTSHKKINPKSLLKTNMIIKLVQIPAYIIIFFLGLICMLTIFTIPITVAYILFDFISISLTGLLGTNGLSRIKDENGKVTIITLLKIFSQYIFCVDVVVAVFAYISIRNKSINTEQNIKYEFDKRNFIPLISFFINTILIGISLYLIEIVYADIIEFQLLPLAVKIYTIFSFLTIIVTFILAFKYERPKALPFLEFFINGTLFFASLFAIIAFAMNESVSIMFIVFSILFFSSIIYGVIILAKVINYYRIKQI